MSMFDLDTWHSRWTGSEGSDKLLCNISTICFFFISSNCFVSELEFTFLHMALNASTLHPNILIHGQLHNTCISILTNPNVMLLHFMGCVHNYLVSWGISIISFNKAICVQTTHCFFIKLDLYSMVHRGFTSCGTFPCNCLTNTYFALKMYD